MGFLAGGFMYLMHPRLHSREEKKKRVMNNGDHRDRERE